MSIYFDKKISLPPDPSHYSSSYGKRIFMEADWHPVQPLLAMSHSDDRNATAVSVYDHSKEETINVDIPLQPEVQITALRWHPKTPLLALGFETGEVLVWNHEDAELFEGARGHSATIMMAEWARDGSLLITSDNMGILIIWKSDLQGHLQTHFIHDFKDPVCHIVFRQELGLVVPRKTREDETNRALEGMTSWRPKTGRNRGGGDRKGRRASRVEPEPVEEKSFFVGVLSGTIYYLKESGSNEEILSSGSSVRSLLYYPAKDLLIILTEAQIMGHFRVSATGDLTEVNKMKVGGRGDMKLFWVGSNTLAMIGRDPIVRLFDIDSSVNFVLEPKPADVSDEESFLSLDYHAKDRLLCCSTNKGKLIMWRETEPPFSEDGESRLTEEGHWEPLPPTVIPSSSKSAKFCPTLSGLLAVNALQDVLLLQEQELCFRFAHQVSLVQTQPSVLSVQVLSSPPRSFEVKVDMQIKGLASSPTHIVIWNGSKVVTYEFGSQLATNYKFVGSFANKSETIVVHDLNLYLLEVGQVQVRTFQGTIKQTLAFTGNEGPPITLSTSGDYLTSGSEFGFLKIWHIGRREAKLHTAPKNLNELVPHLGEIMGANTNANGTKVAFTVAKTNLVPDTKLYVLDLTNNLLQEVNFSGKFIEKFFWEVENPSYLALEVRTLSPELQAILDSEGGEKFRRDFPEDRKPRFKYIKPCKDIKRPWRFQHGNGRIDNHNQGKKTGSSHSNSKSWKLTNQKSLDENKKQVEISLPDKVDHAVITLFADSEKGILVHEKRTELKGQFLVGLEVPYLYLARNSSAGRDFKERNKSISNALRVRVERDVIPEFEGVEDEEKEGRGALMKYVYHTLFSDVDGALRSIRFIKNERIYSNLVRNCIKTKRMDVALLCLAKMREARIAGEVRNTMEAEPETEVHVAMLAVQLAMMEDAERLYHSCSRQDLLLDIYLCAEKWDKALALCQTHRRIQLKTTYHTYGKRLEYDKRIPEAIEMYEKADTHRYEVPRMLLDDPDQLQTYVSRKKDKDLYQWWAQYLESSGDVDSALRYYELAHDWLSLVRLLCFLGSYEKAVQVSNKVEDKASAYHLARTLEDNGEVQKAIRFFSQAGAFGHGIRMCIAHNLADELWLLALKGAPSEQVDAAKYFESVETDKAIQLYHKAGYESKALDLAFTSQEFSALQAIVRDIMNQPNLNTDPLLLQKCADFFVQNDEIEKALDMLCAAHKYTEAMDLCVQNNFTITDELAERLTAPKGVGLDEHTRVRLLEKMGECCTIQGNYHLAAKKYTQAGNKMEAIKSLVKSGDTERIIFYANVSRNRDIYMIAAHYLQTTDWRDNPKTVQHIVQYYTKAQALESLAGFYETVAEAEIEQGGGDYRKALEEYRKASSTWKDVLTCGARQYEDRNASADQKINCIGKFIKIRETLHFDPEAALTELKKLIEDPNPEPGVRKGDMYALIVEHYVKEGQLEKAITVLEKMRNYTKGRSLTHFLNPETTSKLEAALEESNALMMRLRSGEGNRNLKKPSQQPPHPLPSSSSSVQNLLPFLSSSDNENENHAELSEEESVEDDEALDEEEEPDGEVAEAEPEGTEEEEDDDEEEEVIYDSKAQTAYSNYSSHNSQPANYSFK